MHIYSGWTLAFHVTLIHAVSMCSQSDFYSACDGQVFPREHCSFSIPDVEYFSFTSLNSDHSDHVDVAKGSDIELYCKAETAPDSSLTMWLCRASDSLHCFCSNDVILDPDLYTLKFASKDRSINLTYSLTDIDYGLNDTYYCVLQQGLGSRIDGFAQITVNIRDKIKPKIIGSPENRTVAEKKNLDLTCHAEGFPYPTYEWWKDGNQIKVDNKTNIRIEEEELHSILHINNTMREDAGQYHCVATNPLGSAQSKISIINVIPVPGPTGIPWTSDEDKVFIGLGVTGAALTISVIIIVVCVYKWLRKRHAEHDDQLQKSKSDLNIHRQVATNNLILKIDGDGNAINFHGDVIVGGNHVEEELTGFDHGSETDSDCDGVTIDATEHGEEINAGVHLLDHGQGDVADVQYNGADSLDTETGNEVSADIHAQENEDMLPE